MNERMMRAAPESCAKFLGTLSCAAPPGNACSAAAPCCAVRSPRAALAPGLRAPARTGLSRCRRPPGACLPSTLQVGAKGGRHVRCWPLLPLPPRAGRAPRALPPIESHPQETPRPRLTNSLPLALTTPHPRAAGAPQRTETRTPRPLPRAPPSGSAGPSRGAPPSTSSSPPRTSRTTSRRGWLPAGSCSEVSRGCPRAGPRRWRVGG